RSFDERSGTVAADEAGRLYVATGGSSTGEVHAYDEAAGSWQLLGTFDRSVYALAVAPDGTLYAGGSFSSVDGTPAARVARYDGAAWGPLAGGVADAFPYASVFALAAAPDGGVYVGGQFDAVLDA